MSGNTVLAIITRTHGAWGGHLGVGICDSKDSCNRCCEPLSYESENNRTPQHLGHVSQKRGMVHCVHQSRGRREVQEVVVATIVIDADGGSGGGSGYYRCLVVVDIQ